MSAYASSLPGTYGESVSYAIGKQLSIAIGVRISKKYGICLSPWRLGQKFSIVSELPLPILRTQPCRHTDFVCLQSTPSLLSSSKSIDCPCLLRGSHPTPLILLSGFIFAAWFLFGRAMAFPTRGFRGPAASVPLRIGTLVPAPGQTRYHGSLSSICPMGRPRPVHRELPSKTRKLSCSTRVACNERTWEST